MLEILEKILAVAESGRAAAYTVLVETRGSTPQKAGAAMLVFPDGSQTGTLGGGCVEAEVKRQALQLVQQGQPELLTFHLDSDYGWDDGLICGGRMTMLVDPVRDSDDISHFRTFRDLIAAGQACTEAVILDPDKAGGGTKGNRFLFDSAGELVAARGCSNAPPAVTRNLPPADQRHRPFVAEGVAYLTQHERSRLLIVGAGHIGQKVAELATQVDFDVWVLDDRDDYCNAGRFPTAQRCLVAPIDSGLTQIDITKNTFCIIVTRGHNHDEEALFRLAETPARYVGMIGSRRKIRLILEDLLEAGLSREALARVHAPIGFDIGSQTVPEIAISIVAELIACRNLGAACPPAKRRSLTDEIHAQTQSTE